MSQPVLRYRDRGRAVQDLTRALKRRGHIAGIRSVFDAEVRRALREFQSRHLDSLGRPLEADGVAGPLTWWALNNPTMPERPGPPPRLRVPVEGGSTRGRHALAAGLAEMQAGAGEIGSNNSGRWIKKYLNGIIEPPANWCAGFVSWCFDQHADGCPYPYTLGARKIRDHFKRRDWLYEVSESDLPAPGDVIFWWRGQRGGWMGHVGLVYDSAHGIVRTLEGNKGGFPAPVRRFDYTLGRIDKLLGFGRVPL